MKTKRKFVSIVPKSEAAKQFFLEHMNSLHTCRIKNETEENYDLVTINRIRISVNKKGNEHWEIKK